MTPPTRLILLPGMDGTGLLFEPLIAALPPTLTPRVVAYPPDQPLGYDALAELVNRVIARETGPFVLLGESFSGPVSLMIAATAPRDLRALILCASFVKSPLAWFPAALAWCVGSLPFAMAPALAREHMLLGAHRTPALSALLRRAHAMVEPAVMASRARAILRVDVTALLERCPVPLLYLRSTDDRMVSSQAWHLIAQHCPAAHTEVLPGPHLLLQTHPAEAAATIAHFVQGLMPRDAE